LDELYRYREQAMPQSIDGLHPQELISQSYTIEDRENRMVLESALGRLTDTERVIVLALYARGYSQIEIAKRLGYSTRHISRLHRSALKKMRHPFVVIAS
jgi:RNA polymerase sigma factor (sigma-70 family)